MIEKRRRGRPRKREIGQATAPYGPSYWSEDGQVFFNDGWAWAIDLVFKESVNGEARWDVVPICLGREAETKSTLEGKKEIPNDMSSRQRKVLSSILEAKTNGRVEISTRKSGLQRGSYARTLRNRQEHTRRLKARKRIPGYKTY